MDISKVTFPLFKLRTYVSIDKNPLGIVKVTSIHGEYILDDNTIPGTFEERRLQLKIKYPDEKIYKLRERVIYLRQLVKYKSGSVFIDYNGNIVRYRKSSKLYDVKAHKIKYIRPYGDRWSIIRVDDIEIPFIVADLITTKVGYASVMHTKWGPFLYDLTGKNHETYKRKI